MKTEVKVEMEVEMEVEVAAELMQQSNTLPLTKILTQFSVQLPCEQ